MLDKVLLFFVALRLASVFVVQTWYVPDEYWQSLEVAHRLAFGYGHLTWEWTHGVRSYLYPSVIAGLYKLLELVKLDCVELLVLLPRVLQALLSAYSDYRFYVWSGKSKWALYLVATSWFWFYTASRTLANTLEASLTVIALSYFPWKPEKRYPDSSPSAAFLWPVAVSVFLRPTSAIPWVPLCLYHLKKSTHPVWELLMKRYLLIGFVVGTVAVAVDSLFHGSLLLSPYEFVRFNVVKGVGSFYGEHPFYWYFTTGLPTVLAVGVLPFVLGAVQAFRHPEVFKEQVVLLSSVLFTLVVYSLLPHKEFRFLLQVLPLCLYVSADYLSRWSKKASKKFVWVVAILLFAGNVLPAGYMSFVHQRGTLDVMSSVQTIARNYRDEFDQPPKFLFLMPCHSTPYYSHVHHNTTMRFLHCEPNFHDDPSYTDEADTFYKDPAYWLRRNIPVHPRSATPSHVVLFDSLEPELENFLTSYEKKETFFHSDYIDDRRGKDVVLYERFDPNKKTTPAPFVEEDAEEKQPPEQQSEG